MQKTLLLLFILFFTLNIAQSQTWLTDFGEAKKIALKENKKILISFQGSDYCANCKKLNNDLWPKSEFIEFANKNYILVKAEFPRKKKNRLPKEQQEKNNKLAEAYNRNGYFPFIVILDKNAKVLGKTDYKNITALAYIDLLESFK